MSNPIYCSNCGQLAGLGESPQPTSAHTAGRLHVGMRDGCNASQLYIYDGKDQHHDTIVAQVYGIPLHSTVEEASALHRPDTDNGLANAARLALAWNSHDELAGALQNILRLNHDGRKYSYGRPEEEAWREELWQAEEAAEALLAKLTA